MFAEPTDEHQKLLDEINEHINNAVLHFVMSGGYAKMQGNEANIEAGDQLLHILGLGTELEKIQELTGMNVVQVSLMVRQRVNAFHHQMEIDALKEQQQIRAQRRRDWEKERHTQNVVLTSTNSLGDNPLLKQLKDQMDKENHKNQEK
jgi:predicted NAD/FAD-binding protein